MMPNLPPYGMFVPHRMPTPQLADWHTLVLWSEVFPHTQVTKTHLIGQVQRIGKYRGLRLVAAVNSIALHNGATAPGVQLELGNEFTKKLQLVRRPILAEVAKGRILFAEEPLAILAAYIIQHGVEEEPEPDYVMHGFTNALLMVNELFGNEQLDIQRATEAASPGIDRLESFLPMELRAAAIDDEPMDHLIARIHAFVKWAREQSPTINPYLDIDAAFVAIFGYTYEDMTAAGLVMRHYFRSIDSIPQLQTLDPITDIEFLVHPLKVQQPIRDFAQLHSVPIAQLAAELSKRDRMTAAALLPLQRRPLVDLGNGRYACPSLTFLSASLGIGLFHRLAGYYGAQQLRLRFYRFFAQFLQEHTARTIEQAVAKRNVVVVREFDYHVGKQRKNSSDVILIEGRRAVFFDVCNKRLNAELSLNAADLDSMRRDVDGMILDQAKQLDGRIADFRAGRFTINGLGSSDIDDIIPVAITHQSIHGWAATRRYIDRRLREKGYLQNGPRLEVISLAELETLVQAFDGDLSFADLMNARANHSSEIARGRSLKNYLLLDAGWDGKDKCENAGFREWFDYVAIAKLTEWGFTFG
jgi:hypothetical protein